MNLPILYWILGINIITHLLLTLINYLKANSEHPIVFKLIWYWIIGTVNFLIMSMVLFIKADMQSRWLLSYLLPTLGLLAIHFTFDEDWIFRFEKIINFLIMATMSIIIYISWVYLMF